MKFQSILIIVVITFLAIGCKDSNLIKEPQFIAEFNSVDCIDFDINRTNLECGYLKVPDDYFQKKQIFQLPIVIKRASGDLKDKSTPLIYNIGGPGSSAIDSLEYYLNVFEQTTNRDVIIYDRRGEGKTISDFECKEIQNYYDSVIQEKLNDLRAVGIAEHNITKENYEEHLQLLFQEKYRSCIEHLEQKKLSLSFFTTRTLAYDMESLRRALGYEKVVLLGTSYGTRLSLEYVKLYPEYVESLILDGVIPEDIDYYTYEVSIRQESVKKFLDLCSLDIKCSSAYPNLEEEFLFIVNYLNTTPYPLKESINGYNTLNGIDFFNTFYDLLYYRNLLSTLPFYIHSIYLGILNENFEFLEYLANRFSITGNNDPTQNKLLFDSIHYHDRPIDVYSLVENYENVDSSYRHFFPKWRIFEWKDRHKIYNGRDDFIFYDYNFTAPVLLLSGSLDPITPSKYAQSLHQRLQHSTHIIINNGAHVQLGSSCISQTLESFLNNSQTFTSPTCVNEENLIDFYTPSE